MRDYIAEGGALADSWCNGNKEEVLDALLGCAGDSRRCSNAAIAIATYRLLPINEQRKFTTALFIEADDL